MLFGNGKNWRKSGYELNYKSKVGVKSFNCDKNKNSKLSKMTPLKLSYNNAQSPKTVAE